MKTPAQMYGFRFIKPEGIKLGLDSTAFLRVTMPGVHLQERRVFTIESASVMGTYRRSWFHTIQMSDDNDSLDAAAHIKISLNLQISDWRQRQDRPRFYWSRLRQHPRLDNSIDKFE